MNPEQLHLDHDRGARTGVPEVVYGEGKTHAACVAALRGLHARAGFALGTRIAPEVGVLLAQEIPTASYDAVARAIRCGRLTPSGRRVAVVCAGTADLPVAAEAAFVLDAFGHAVVRTDDVGVAGIHRLFLSLEVLAECDVVIVVAGMEGALPSVVAGLIAAPVIAVPTSVGYGVAEGGHTALHTMLASCAPGIAVVNIDNGFGAAALAHKIVRTCAR